MYFELATHINGWPAVLPYFTRDYVLCFLRSLVVGTFLTLKGQNGNTMPKIELETRQLFSMGCQKMASENVEGRGSGSAPNINSLSELIIEMTERKQALSTKEAFISNRSKEMGHQLEKISHQIAQVQQSQSSLAVLRYNLPAFFQGKIGNS